MGFSFHYCSANKIHEAIFLDLQWGLKVLLKAELILDISSGSKSFEVLLYVLKFVKKRK